MLEIKNLHVSLAEEGTPILEGLSLTVPKGEVHAIMGPNGSGKSTLAYVLAGRDDYAVTEGEVLWNGESVLDMSPDERAAKGIFLAFQYPLEIPGVSTMTFLRTAANALRKAHGESELTTPEFLRLVREQSSQLGVPDEMLKRPLNVGFSGGEKKRMEILQMTMFQPTLCVMDETDSGLDIDAVRVVAAGEALLAPAITRRLIAEFARMRPRTTPHTALNLLTPRETDVLRLIAEGLSNPEIASRLVVSEQTVKTHVSRVLSKLNLRDRTQAVVAAYESGLVIPRTREL